MEQATNKRNVYLDLFKYFLSFLVIAIHLTGEYYSHFPLYRLAVAMFFLISGYFNYSPDNIFGIRNILFLYANPWVWIN